MNEDMEEAIVDRLALLLAIKEEGKLVTLDHLREKVSRDAQYGEGRAVGEEEVREALEWMKVKGLAEEVEVGKYRAGRGLQDFLKERVKRSGVKLNRSYLLVWRAINYYPKIASAILPFLKGRAVTAVKVFSGKKDPLNEIEPIFVRYAKYKPRPINLTVGDEGRLLELVYDHCVDFIPYIHPLDSSKPDIFVLDLDAGSQILAHERGFEYVKLVTKEFAEMLLDMGVSPMVKFSGSRGFQLWASFDASKLEGDVFKAYRDLAIRLQAKLEERLKAKKGELVYLFGDLIDPERGFTTSTVARKAERSGLILIDWSSMKPQGDVRAPFSLHYKTGMASVPLRIEELEDFRVDDAEPERVVEDLSRYKRAVEELRLSPLPSLTA